MTRPRELHFPPPARHPLVVMLNLAGCAQGLLIVTGGRVPPSIAAVLSKPLVVAWGLGLLLSCGMYLAAALWRDVITGVLIERAACFLVVLSVGGYIAGLIGSAGTAGLTYPTITTACYGIACAIRVWQITADLHRATRALLHRPRAVRS